MILTERLKTPTSSCIENNNGKYYACFQYEITKAKRDAIVADLDAQKTAIQSDSDLSDSGKAKKIADIDAQLSKIAE